MSENLPINDEPEIVDADDAEGHANRPGRAYKSGGDAQGAEPLTEPVDTEDDVEGHATRIKF